MKDKLEAEFGGQLQEDDCLVTSACTSTKFRYVLHVPAVDYSCTKARLGTEGQVVHTVSSVDRISSCTTAALEAAAKLAQDDGVTSIAFPLLGAGSGRVPVGSASRAMADAMRAFVADDQVICRVVLAVPEDDRFATCKRVFDAVFGRGS
jgi:O-acetyl-ADP-ribose deacetylase (regulator of RNase III)